VLAAVLLLDELLLELLDELLLELFEPQPAATITSASTAASGSASRRDFLIRSISFPGGSIVSLPF
jgi:hypothetical protein